jgi:hypothetical protein
MGEHPLTCHCGKQFSCLDNLRQHVQIVHADKQEQNEQMMRDLTSLHATTAAANKAGAPRSKRGAAGGGSSSANVFLSESQQDNESLDSIIQEDMGEPFRGHPGTSIGYEGDHNGIIYQQGTTWHVQSLDMDRASTRPTNNHSFRDCELEGENQLLLRNRLVFDRLWRTTRRSHLVLLRCSLSARSPGV